MEEKQQKWEWAVFTTFGIFSGDLIGVLEPGDTVESCLAQAGAHAMMQIELRYPRHAVVGCLVSDGTLRVTVGEVPASTVFDEFFIGRHKITIAKEQE